MRAVLVTIGVILVVCAAAFIGLVVMAEMIQPDQGEVRIELEDTFPQ